MVGETSSDIECFRCGICCTRFQPQLSPGEVKTIAKKLNLSVNDFLAKYAQTTVIGYLLRQSDKGCIFLQRHEDGLSTCAIYAFRPRPCREWLASLSRPECQEGLLRVHRVD